MVMWQTRMPNDVFTIDSWTTLTYLAAKTENIRLGTQFSPIPRGNPAQFAKMLSTLDVLSEGRVQLGVGAGWSQNEFEGFSVWDEPKIRVDKTEEGVKLMIRLWTEDEVTFNGRYYHAERAMLEPKPVQKPYPALFISGRPRSNRMLRFAGRYGDLFNVAGGTAAGEDVGEEEILQARDVVLEAARKANRLDKIAYVRELRATKDLNDYSRGIEQAIRLDAKYCIVYFPRDGNYIEEMRRFAKEIMPSYK